MQTPSQIPYNEFLGKFVKINKATNARNSNRSGIAVNETKNMIFLMNPKSGNVMKFPKAEICDYEI